MKNLRKPQYTLPGTVFDAALNRIRWLFDEFEHVAICSSGGKDSTVITQLALIVARERGRLPLRVLWLDQECEFEATVTYQRQLLQHPDVDARWYQVPFRMFNATSHDQTWLNVWGEGEEWVRPKEPGSVHVNDFGIDRFVELLIAIGDREAPGGAILTGVRAEESPARRLGLTSYPTYKWVTWGSKQSTHSKHTLFHPIYDWSYKDVWRAIAEHGWAYNRMYDHMHRYGVPPRKMRVSNYHHETAIHHLFYLQEIEPATWEAATRRLHGINAAGHAGAKDFFVTDLPFMFSSWTEYRDYLLDNLITDDGDREKFRHQFEGLDRRLWYTPEADRSKAEVQALIANDLYFTKLNQFYVTRYLTKEERARRGLIKSEAAGAH